MRKILAATTIAAAALALMPAANAVPISDGSTINFTGNALFNATQVTFTNPVDLKAGSGDFTALGTCTACATATSPFVYSPFTAYNDLFTVTNNGLTATVDVTSELAAPIKNANNTALIVQDNAVLSLTGFDDTPGILTLTVNQSTGGISGSFSATGETVVGAVEPMSVALLGAGILGLGIIRRRTTSA